MCLENLILSGYLSLLGAVDLAAVHLAISITIPVSIAISVPVSVAISVAISGFYCHLSQSLLPSLLPSHHFSYSLSCRFYCHFYLAESLLGVVCRLNLFTASGDRNVPGEKPETTPFHLAALRRT